MNAKEYFMVRKVKGEPRLRLVTPLPKRLTTERALDLSIAKWETIADYAEEHEVYVADGANTTCALCHKFYDNEPRCMGCPVYAKTGNANCHETPYWDYLPAQPHFALAELLFLKSLKGA